MTANGFLPAMSAFWRLPTQACEAEEVEKDFEACAALRESFPAAQRYMM